MSSGLPILIHSNAPWVGSGYGAQAMLFGTRLRKAGYQVAFSAFYGLSGSWIPWDGPDGEKYIVYPGSNVDRHANDLLGSHAKHWFGGDPEGIVFLISDPWVIKPYIPRTLGRFMAWTPIDHDPLIPATHNWIKKSGAYPISMSRFGERVLEAQGHRTSYVPHGYDPLTFFPMDREHCRRQLKIPQDAFVVTMVAANTGRPSRKSFGEALTAFSVFQRKHPEALLYLFTKMESDSGEDIAAQIDALRIRAMVCDQYGLDLGTPAAVVAATMNASDVLLNPAKGEGYGVCLLESQACGTPCIVSDFSAMPEVAPVSAGNWAVSGQEYWNGNFLSYQITPNIAELIESLEECYAEPEKEREYRRNRVLAHARLNQADVVMEQYMLPALQNAQIDFDYQRQKMIPLDDDL